MKWLVMVNACAGWIKEIMVFVEEGGSKKVLLKCSYDSIFYHIITLVIQCSINSSGLWDFFFWLAPLGRTSPWLQDIPPPLHRREAYCLCAARIPVLLYTTLTQIIPVIKCSLSPDLNGSKINVSDKVWLKLLFTSRNLSPKVSLITVLRMFELWLMTKEVTDGEHLFCFYLYLLVDRWFKIWQCLCLRFKNYLSEQTTSKPGSTTVKKKWKTKVRDIEKERCHSFFHFGFGMHVI